jgi:UDP-N-acetylmuramoyl-tripeptide--D-alanyl-D-alanine ligase
LGAGAVFRDLGVNNMTCMMTLQDAHEMLPGSVLVGDAATEILRVHSDTRSLQAGDLFVALKGERFDAHDFLPQAKASGAVAALAQRGLVEAGIDGLLVDDTRTALSRLAKAWRACFDIPLIAVTGSNGKTTVTQMIASILQAWHADGGFATQGNFNNDVGVPLTLLRLRQDADTWHSAGVVELGMNHEGEIAQLAALVQPTVALVNNAQREHQEFMASVDAVARENGAVISALQATGTAVFPADDEHTPLWQALAGTRPVLTFALDHATADIAGRAQWFSNGRGAHWALELHTPAGDAPVVLALAGEHNVKNALAAAACALAAGAPLAAIVRGLEAFQPVKGRSQLKSVVRGERRIPLIDDSYNANPDSVRAAIDVLSRMTAPHWLVLGDMGEVGDHGPAFHREVGEYAKTRGIAALWTAGAQSAEAASAFGTGARHFDSVAALVAALHEAPAFESALVKGSRFMKMEQVVEALHAA